MPQRPRQRAIVSWFPAEADGTRPVTSEHLEALEGRTKVARVWFDKFTTKDGLG